MNKEQHKMSRFTDNYSPYNGNAMNLICCYSYKQTTEFINNTKKRLLLKGQFKIKITLEKRPILIDIKMNELSLIDSPKYT